MGFYDIAFTAFSDPNRTEWLEHGLSGTDAQETLMYYLGGYSDNPLYRYRARRIGTKRDQDVSVAVVPEEKRVYFAFPTTSDKRVYRAKER